MSSLRPPSDRPAARAPAPHAQPLILAHALDQLGGLDAAAPETIEWALRDPALAFLALAGRRDEGADLVDQVDAGRLKQWLVMAALRALDPAPEHLPDWRVALACALYCQGLARRLGFPDSNQAYLAGLFHNLDRHVDEPAPTPAWFRVAAWLADWEARPVLTLALAAQGEDSARLAEALPLARLLRVARAVVAGENDSYALAAILVPELTPDDLDAIRRDTEQTVARLDHALRDGQDAARSTRARLATALAEFFQIEHLHAALAGAASETAALDAGLAILADQLGLVQPVYLVHDRATATLAPQAGHRHACPGLRIRLPGSNSAAAWALTSREAVVFATGDAESVSLLDRQLAQQCGLDAVVAIPVGGPEVDGVLLTCASLGQAAHLERSAAHLGRIGRLLGRALDRLRAAPAPADQADFMARARRAVHEINNPLGIAKNYLAILAAKLADQDQVADELTILGEELDRIPAILRDLAAGEPVARRQSCDLGAVARDLARMAESALAPGRRVRIATRVEPDLPRLRSDPGKLKQLLLNLILNALEACPDDGQVDIEAFASIDLRGGRHAVIAVTDNGPGIAQDKLAYLFEPTASDKGGQHAGLGLAIVKTLATELGLTVACRTGAGGTTFQIAAPAN
jgi:signal transduction histidine kinase